MWFGKLTALDMTPIRLTGPYTSTQTQTNLKGNWYTFREATLSKCFAFHPNRGYTKRKEFAPIGSKFFPFRVDPFLEGPCYAWKAKRKSQKLSAWYGRADNIPGLSSPLNYTPGIRSMQWGYIVFVFSVCLSVSLSVC